MSRNQTSKVPPREVVNGSRRCTMCGHTDLACTCADDYHRAEVRALIGGRIEVQEDDHE